MMMHILNELNKFIITFGLIIIVFVVVGHSLSTEFKNEDTELWGVILDIFDGLSGNQDFKEYKYP